MILTRLPRMNRNVSKFVHVHTDRWIQTYFACGTYTHTHTFARTPALQLWRSIELVLLLPFSLHATDETDKGVARERWEAQDYRPSAQRIRPRCFLWMLWDEICRLLNLFWRGGQFLIGVFLQERPDHLGRLRLPYLVEGWVCGWWEWLYLYVYLCIQTRSMHVCVGRYKCVSVTVLILCL